jgi:hypothetical protein
MAKLTEAQLAARKKDVIERLARSPELTLGHFQRRLGYDYRWLYQIQAEGVKFGKPVKVHLRLSK